MRWEALLLILYAIAIIFIIIQFSGLWSLSLILMLILLISLIQKIYFDKENRKTNEKGLIIDTISKKIDIVITRIEDMMGAEKKDSENMRNSIMCDIENIILDLQKRVVDVESKLIDIKENVDISKSEVDRRIHNVERILKTED